MRPTGRSWNSDSGWAIAWQTVVVCEAVNDELTRWENRFAGDEYAFGEAPNDFLQRSARLLPASGRALAVADGEGRNGVWLAQQGLQVDSFDFSPRGVAKAKSLAERRGVAINARAVDIFDYGWPAETFDLVVAIFIQFVGPKEREQVFASIKRTLKSGGVLLLEGYTPKQVEYGTGGPKARENMYTREILERSFADFANIEISEYEADLHEGTSHSGRSALIDLVGVK